jgi:2,3-bisphosphoglycerate-independent phosphoglycerate mutase
MKKIIFIVIDGLADEPIKAFGGKTPLEAARIPNLTFMAKNGFCGAVEPFMFDWQKYPTSEDSHLALFGFEPKRYDQGRGIFEALGVGVPLRSRDVALRINFATVDSNFIIKDRRAGRIEDTQALINDLNKIKIKGAQIFVKKAFGHRAVMRIRSTKDISPEVTDSDPKVIGKISLEVKAKNKTKAAIFTARILNEFISQSSLVLKSHFINQERKKKGMLPANYILIRGAGRFRKLPSFKKLWGLKACCIAGGGLYKGIASALGMEIIKVKGANGRIDTNLKEKMSVAKRVLKKYDFAFVHIKAADNLAEDGNYAGKKSFIEKIDKQIKILLDVKNYLVVIVSDHKTCCEKKMHCAGDVPFLIFGGEKNNTLGFNEESCKKLIIPAKNFLKFVLELQKK